jgi:hypothetical protein
MKQRTFRDKRIRKNISILRSVLVKAKELTASRSMGTNKFSQLLADLVLDAHRRQGSDEGKAILELLAKLSKLEKEIEGLKIKHQQALAFADSYDCQARAAYKKIAQLEREARDRRLEDLRQASKNPNQAKDPKRGGAPAT